MDCSFIKGNLLINHIRPMKKCEVVPLWGVLLWRVDCITKSTYLIGIVGLCWGAKKNFRYVQNLEFHKADLSREVLVKIPL